MTPQTNRVRVADMGSKLASLPLLSARDYTVFMPCMLDRSTSTMLVSRRRSLLEESSNKRIKLFNDGRSFRGDLT
jgi:hypothetical protein